MSDASKIYDLYKKSLAADQEMMAAWPPIMTNIQIGSYGKLDDGGFTAIGLINDYTGKNLSKSIVSQGGSLAVDLSAGKYTTAKYQIKVDGTAVETDEFPAETNFQGSLDYTFQSDVNFAVVFNPVDRNDIDSSIEIYLEQKVWPAIQAVQNLKVGRFLEDCDVALHRLELRLFW